MAAAAGMGETDFWNSSARWVVAFIRGSNDRQTAQIKTMWETARHIGWANIVPHDAKSHFRTARDWLALPWDSEYNKKANEEAAERLKELSTNFFAGLDEPPPFSTQ